MSFDLETITLSGKTLRRLMQQSARFGIEHYQELENQCVKDSLTMKTPLFNPSFNFVLQTDIIRIFMSYKWTYNERVILKFGMCVHTVFRIHSSSDLDRNGTTIMPSFSREHWQQPLAMGI